jgi:hypothetical protein
VEHPKFGRILGLVFLISLVTIGFEAGQDQKKSPSTPPPVTVPPEEIDPARQQLVEDLKYYRKIGDRAGAEAILRLLDPSLTYMPSEKARDTIVTPGIEGPPDFQVEWRNPDIPVFNTSYQETHPVMDFVRSGTNYPMIIAACDISGMIYIKGSSDHGVSWSFPDIWFGLVAPSGPLRSPQIKQCSHTRMGIVFEEWMTTSNPDVYFCRIDTDIPDSVYVIAIDNSSAVTVKPYIASDYEYFGGYAFLYVAYYKITYEPDVNPAQPYRYNLMFTRSSDWGNYEEWTTPTSLGTFRSASGEVPVYCSIDYEDYTLYLAYIGESTRDIRVRRSTDSGASWSSATVLKTGNVYEPEVAVGDSTHAIVTYTAGLAPDRDPLYHYTNDGTTWYQGNLGIGYYDDEYDPVVRHYGGRYYAAYRNQDTSQIWTMNAPIDSPPSYNWSSATSVKNSANGVSIAPRPVNLIAKPGPSGTVGSAAIWVEDIATADVYFDARWQPIPVIRTPISDISFGNVGVGNYVDSTTTIYNDGNCNLIVSSVTRTSGSTNFTYQGPTTPFTIAANSYTNVMIRFAPAAVGPYSATFTVSSNDPDNSNTTFSTSGTGIFVSGPDINMPVLLYGFGSVPIALYKEANLTVQNLGTETLTISSVTWSEGSFDFTVVSYPSSVAASSSGIITIGVKPTGWGTRGATFAISSNDPDEPTYYFNASVNGTDGLWLLVNSLTTNEIYSKVMDRTDTWGQWNLQTGATDQPLGGAYFQNRAYMVAKGLKTMDIWYRYIDYSGWGSWEKMALGGSPSTSALAQFDNRLYLAVRGSDNNIYLRSMNTSGVWGPWAVLSGATSAAPALAYFNNRLHLIVKGLNDNAIWHNSMDASETWAGWALLDGASPTTAGLSYFNNRLYLAVKGMDNIIYLKSMDTSGIWNSWTQVLPGATSHTPAIASFNGYLYMVVKGLADGKIWMNKMNTAGVWSGWTQILDGTSTAPCLFLFPWD